MSTIPKKTVYECIQSLHNNNKKKNNLNVFIKKITEISYCVILATTMTLFIERPLKKLNRYNLGAFNKIHVYFLLEL